MSRAREAQPLRRTLRLRAAGPADALGILDLERHFPSDRMSLRSVRHLLRSPAARVWVVQAQVIIAALILLTRRNSKVARIYSVVVSPAARGQGLAQRLVRAAEREARASGCERIALEVREDNAAARGLYANLGYTQSALLRGYYDDGADGLRLSKALR